MSQTKDDSQVDDKRTAESKRYELVMQLWGHNLRYPPEFLRAPRPKTSAEPTRQSIQLFLQRGWWAQPKMRGHSAQIHLQSDGFKAAYTHNGAVPKTPVPKEVTDALHVLFPSLEGPTIVLADWAKSRNTLFLFDVLKINGRRLTSEDYSTRYSHLPRFTGSKHFVTLPVLTTVIAAHKALMESYDSDHIEGLLFRAPHHKGLEDMALVRCRKTGVQGK